MTTQVQGEQKSSLPAAGILTRLGTLTPFQRIAYTKTAVAVGFAAGLLLSPKLWISSRLFPLIPVVQGLPQLHFPLDYICAALLFFLLCTIMATGKPRPYIFGFAALLLFLAVSDQTRWQPWAYLYFFILLSLSCFSWKSDDAASAENTLNICRLIIAATYFYSGLQKLNRNFAELGMSSLLGSWARYLPQPHLWPWIMACIEASIGIGLLTRRWRKAAVIYGVLMHLFILFADIVIMHWNSVVWPWNVAMIAFLVFLFWNADFSVRDVLWRDPLPFHKIVLVLFAVMPFFSFFGWWDSYLSASLYSANTPQANVVFRDDLEGQLPSPIHAYVKKLPGATDVLVIRDWAVDELNVMPYPAMRAYRVIGQQVCRYTNNSADVTLVMRDKDTWLSKGADSHDTCLGTLMVNKY